MDYMEKITELRSKKGELLAQAEKNVADGDFSEADAITSQMEDINKQIKTLEDLSKASNERADKEYDGVLHIHTGTPEDRDRAKPFASLGEQLKAIYNVTKNHTEDRRLLQVNNEALGANEGVGTDGGFVIQTDFAGMILESAVASSPLLNRLDRHTCSNPANSMRWLTAKEGDVSSDVYGGIAMHWAAEGMSAAASKPGFQEAKLDLEKMMGFMYVTDEMLSDTTFMSGFMGQAFSLAADRLLVDGVIAGDGIGKPLGILHSKAAIEIPKQDKQAARTFVGDNAVKMLASALPRNRERLVWLMHPDVEEQLPYLALHSGGADKFLWNPEGGLGAFDTQRVLNKPVLFEDSCSALGEKGDVMLVDPLQYILLVKGTVKQEWSMHVAFLTDQECFRVVFRCNGMPKVNTPVTVKNSTKPRSPFVLLGERK